MLEIIVWIILFSFFSGIVLVLHYWATLLREKDQYTREELVDFLQIILKQIQVLTSHGSPGLNYMALGAGIGAAWLLTLFGGLVSPNSSPSPDHAGAEMPNYFFQSALFVLIAHVVWPSLKDFAVDRGGRESLFFRIVDSDIPFFFGLATALGAINVAVWGVYHEMSFLFCFLNMLICLGYAGYRLTGLPGADDDIEV